jgi:2'-5' RNA ligase
LFVAISVPEEIKTEIETAQAELRRALPADCVRWTKREQFHLTLKFLGNVPVDVLRELQFSVRKACDGIPVLRLRAERIGAFPGMKSPRVIWAGVENREGLLPKLQQMVEIAVEGFTAETAEAGFRGHVTLGRVKHLRRPQAERLAKRVGVLTDRYFGEWAADKIEIIRSELSAGGACYTTLAAVPLGCRDNR